MFGRDGGCIAEVSMVGPTMRLSDDHLPRAIRQVRRCAGEISESMGCRSPCARGA
jgi:DNA-binding IclR family transcriptional regulator